MTVKPDINRGQKLSRPEGQTIGFVDTKEQFEAVTKVLKAAGYAESDIVASKGEDGKGMLKRLQEAFNFGDGEDALMEFSIKELRVRNYALGLERMIEMAHCELPVCPSL